MKRLFYCLAAALTLLCSCHESMEKRAVREAREYTEKYCPTPVQNYTRTDSVAFDTNTKTYHYYSSVVGDLDDKNVFDMNRDKITQSLIAGIKENTGFRAYKKEGFSFAWTLRSGKNPKVVYFDKRFTPKEYN